MVAFDVESEAAAANANETSSGQRQHNYPQTLNDSLPALNFDLSGPEDNSHLHDDGGPTTPIAEEAPLTANYHDYLKAQRRMKMQSIRPFRETRRLSSMIMEEGTTLPEQHPVETTPVRSAGVQKKNRRASLAAAGRRYSMAAVLQDLPSSSEEEDDDLLVVRDEQQHDTFNHHHASSDHTNLNVPWYCVPVQRQRWGDPAVLPHINWADLFFDLFYVAAAYNLGVLLISAMNPKDWPRGLVYFVGIFGPLYGTWENDLNYSSRYMVVDHFHRIFDIVRFLLVASQVLHIKSLEVLSDSTSTETLALMTSITLEALMALAQNVELVLYADGDRIAIVNHTTRKIKHHFFPKVLAYLAATIVAAVQYARNNQDDGGYDGDAGTYNGYTNTDGYENNNSTLGYETKNTTDYAGEGTGRYLAAATSYEGGEGTNWSVADIPYFICCVYYLFDQASTTIRKFRFARNKSLDIRKYFVPNNIDYLIHRYGDFTMLMIGESVLSLLIVETADSREYYVIACVGALTVIILQILKFESEPSHSEGHALWRSMGAAVSFQILMQVLSMALIAFGVSYKVMLTTIVNEVLEDEAYDCSAVNADGYDDPYQRFLAEEPCGRRHLAAVPTVTSQATASLYSASLTIVLVSLELMILTHKGLKKNWKRLFKRDKESDEKGLDIPLVIIGILKVFIIIFTATINQWETDAMTISILGLVIVSTMAISRVVAWGFVHKKEEIKRMATNAKLSTGRAVSSVARKAADVAASVGSAMNSVKSVEEQIELNRAVWDLSFDAIVITDSSGIIRHVNQTCLMTFGYQHDKELLGHNISILVGGDDADHHSGYMEAFRKANRTSSTIGKERVLRSRRKDGSEFPCIVGIRQLPGSDDLIGYIRNTTGLATDPKKQSEIKILDPVDRLIDDTSFDSIVATDKNGIIINCNMTTLSEFLYYSKDDLLGQDIACLVGGGHATNHHKYVSRFQNKQKSETMLGRQRLLKAVRADKSEFECLVAINTVPDTDGCLVGYIRNIHGEVSRKARREVADAMSAMSRESDDNTMNILDESFDAIIVASEDGVIRRVNLTALAMFGYDDKKELTGKNLSTLVGGGHAEKHDSYMKRFVESKKHETEIGRQRVLMARRKDDTEFPCIIGIKRMRNTKLLVGYIRDVSELNSEAVQITNIAAIDPLERLMDDESFDSIIAIDFSGKIHKVNMTAVKEFGYSSKEKLEGMNVSAMVGGDMTPEKHDAMLQRFRERGLSSLTIGKQRILYSKRKDGTEFPSIIGIRRVPETEYLIGHIKNMTGLSTPDEKGARTTLELSTAVDDCSFDSIIVIDLEGLIVEVNKTAVEEFRYDSKDDIKNLNISALVGGGDASKHGQYLARYREKGKTGSSIGKRRRLLARRKDGTEFACIIGIKTMADSNYLIGYITNTENDI